LGRIYGKDIDVEKAAYDNKDYFFASMLNFKMFFKKE
jgi:YHS domain-containing protein